MTPAALKQLEADLWRSADTLRANSDLKASEYSAPVRSKAQKMNSADHHAKYCAHEQTKHCSSDKIEKIAGAIANAQVLLGKISVEGVRVGRHGCNVIWVL